MPVPFSTDRDLLIAEPNVFTDLAFLGQERIHVGDAVLQGTALTSALADFDAADIACGAVALVGLSGAPSVAFEVVARPDGHTLTVSLPRTAVGEEPLPGAIPGAPAGGGPLDLIVRTFAPQAMLVHDRLLHLLDLDGRCAPCVGEEAIVSLSAVGHLEVLGTLATLYGGAGALTDRAADLLARARDYQNRFQSALRRAVIRLDLDGDGYPDARRRFDTIQLTRT